MTRDEAVNVLKNTALILGRVNGKMALAEALQMAITALQTDGDCISKQAAIDTAAEYENELCEILGDENELVEVVKILKHRLIALPSVQPEPCEDTISRADAIRVASGYCHPANVAKELAKLPSAQPELKWIPTKVKPDPDLPEEEMSGYFLVTLHTYGDIGFDMDEYEVKKMRWNRVNGWVLPVHSPAWIEEALTQDVLAWKPCPEPYREEGEK